MKKKFFVAALAATMFASAAFGLAACSKDPAVGGDLGDGGLGGGGGGGGGGGANTVVITLDANGGSFIGSGATKTVNAANGKIDTQPAAPTTKPANKTFYGWGVSASSTDKLTFPKTFTKPTTIYAIWSNEGGGGGGGTEYTITFDPDGGTIDVGYSSTVTTTDGRIPHAKIPHAKKDEYELEGWYTAKNGGGTQITSSYAFDGTVTTVYANWKKSEEQGGGDDVGADASLIIQCSDGKIKFTVVTTDDYVYGLYGVEGLSGIFLHVWSEDTTVATGAWGAGVLNATYTTALKMSEINYVIVADKTGPQSEDFTIDTSKLHDGVEIKLDGEGIKSYT